MFLLSLIISSTLRLNNMKNSTQQSLKLLIGMIIILSQPFMLQSAWRKTARSATRGSLGRVNKGSISQSLPSCNLNTPLESSSYLQGGMRKPYLPLD